MLHIKNFKQFQSLQDGPRDRQIKQNKKNGVFFSFQTSSLPRLPVYSFWHLSWIWTSGHFSKFITLPCHSFRILDLYSLFEIFYTNLRGAYHFWILTITIFHKYLLFYYFRAVYEMSYRRTSEYLSLTKFIDTITEI